MSNAVHIPTDLDIMMFLDGELSGDAAEQVEKFLQNDEDANAKAIALGQISELIRGNMELAADEAEDKLAGLWTGIDRGINSNGVAKSDVISIHSKSEPAKQAKSAEDLATDALVEKASWFGGWQSHMITGAIVAAAVAVIMVATQSNKAEQATAVRVIDPTVIETVGTKTVGTKTVPVVLKSQAPEVEKLEVYNGNGTIMMVGGEEESSAVIWISNDSDIVEDPI